MLGFLNKTKKEKITKDTTVAEIIKTFPGAAVSFRKYGIEFIGKDLSPLESLEKVAYGNDLTDEKLNKMIEEINEEMNKKPVEKVGNDFITLTSAASEEFRKILKNKDKKGIRFRLVSSGCALYVYDMEFASRSYGDEIEFEKEGVLFFVQKKNIPLLEGVVIDYDEEKGGFKFDNPHVAEC